MTPDLIKLSHTPEGQDRLRVMLAELVGLLDPPNGSKVLTQRWDAQGNGVMQMLDWKDGSRTSRFLDNLPNFTRDLNAVHEVERGIPDPGLYFERLDEICRKQSALKFASPGVWSVSATALQRTIALILTLQSKR